MPDITRFLKPRSIWCPLGACLLFFFAGQAFLPLIGIEDDEALFTWAAFRPRGGSYVLNLGTRTIPVMLETYLGTLKAWIYAPIFHHFGSSIYTLREPALIAGAISLWLFYLLLRRISGGRAAVIGCALLSVDATYLLTTCFDWGPVALQHLLLVGGLLLLLRFYQQGGLGALAGGFFLLGLAMWDKALAIWMLSGFGLAGILMFPRQIWGVITPGRLATATLAFALGALPLIVYNVDSGGATFRGNATFDTSELPKKVHMLSLTMTNRALFDWMAREDWSNPAPRPPAGPLQKASARVAAVAGYPHESLQYWAFGLALLLIPLARGRDLRALLFALIAMAVAWAQMAFTANTGGSVHHTILLWPLPQWIIAISFVAAARRLGRWGLAALAPLVSVVLISGLLVMNQYYFQMVRNGGGVFWSDAIYPLSRYVKNLPSRNIVCMDWGIVDSLRLLSGGRLRLQMGTGWVDKPALTTSDRDALAVVVRDPNNVFIAHAASSEFMEGLSDKLIKAAGEMGYRREELTAIADSFGRPFFEVYRFSGPARGSPAAP